MVQTRGRDAGLLQEKLRLNARDSLISVANSYGQLAETMEAHMMKRDDANAIADFLEDGGQIVKMKAAIPATEQDLYNYLASCGLPVKYAPGEAKPYRCNTKGYNLTALLRFANDHRRSQQLAPLML